MRSRVVVATLGLLLAALPQPARAADPRPWLTDLRFPVNMAWAPGGTLFFIEKEAGNVRHVVDGRLISDPVAHVDVFVSFETGLLGLAVHPDWPDEPWIYLYRSDPATGRNELLRFRVEDGRATDRETLIDEIATSGFHNSGELLFGPDGMLYLTTGDGTEEDPAQDLSDPRGKILRFTPDGDVPSDNPIAGNLLYSLGHRNSFGLCVDPDTGDLWQTENGEPIDEVNRIVAGGNYGWPIVQGPSEDERFRDPVATLRDAAPTGCAVWRGAVYFGSYTRGELLRWPLDGGPGSIEVVSRFSGPVYDVAVGPDDRLYVSTDDTIWTLGNASSTTETPSPEGTVAPDDPGTGGSGYGLPYLAVGALLAIWLFLTMRRARRLR
jgi:glucose/arabinose dehydrogenase